MTEPLMTAVTVEITIPSNYAENKRGAKVSLSGAYPEGTTCEQAKPGNDALAVEAERVALAIVQGTSSLAGGSASSVSAVAVSAPAPAPEKTAASIPTEAKRQSKPKPSEVVIGGTAPTAERAASVAAPVSVITETQPPFAQAQTGAATTEAQAAPPAAAPSAAIASPSTGGSLPPFLNGSAGPAVSAPPPALQPASTAAPGEISDLDARRMVADEIVRINKIVPGQGGNVVNDMIGRHIAPPAGLLAMTQDQRKAFFAELAAWKGPVQ